LARELLSGGDIFGGGEYEDGLASGDEVVDGECEVVCEGGIGGGGVRERFGRRAFAYLFNEIATFFHLNFKID
jgi:hypothetical protein